MCLKDINVETNEEVHYIYPWRMRVEALRFV